MYFYWVERTVKRNVVYDSQSDVAGHIHLFRGVLYWTRYKISKWIYGIDRKLHRKKKVNDVVQKKPKNQKKKDKQLKENDGVLKQNEV